MSLDYSWHRYYLSGVVPDFSGAKTDDYELGRFTQVDPLWQKYPSLTPYNYCGNNPLVRVDTDGLFWNYVLGAVVGGGLDYAFQVTYNIYEGQSFEDAFWTNVDMKSVGISAAAGAGGAGLATKISKISSIGAKVAANATTDAAVSAGSQYAKTGTIDPNKVVIDAVAGTMIGSPVKTKAGKIASNSTKGKILARDADRANRIAAKSSRTGRQTQAANAQKSYNRYVNAVAIGAGTAASGTASKIGKKANEELEQ